MTRETIQITNKLGLHARAAAKLSHLCNKYKSEIFLIYKEDRVNAKSLLGILTLAASIGTDITIETNGSDEKRAIKKIIELFDLKFGEEN